MYVVLVVSFQSWRKQLEQFGSSSSLTCIFDQDTSIMKLQVLGILCCSLWKVQATVQDLWFHYETGPRIDKQEVILKNFKNQSLI